MRVQPSTAPRRPGAQDTLWFALCMAPEEGTEIGELMHRHRHEPSDPVPAPSQHAKAGRAVQVSRGHWRAATTEEPHYE